jgi:two-component system, OmpR family, sensor kinase
MSTSLPFLFLRRSAPAKLAFIALLFIAAVILVRSLSLGRLTDVDITSSEIRNRWLESIQILGDLRHHVARVRTEEAERLLGAGPNKSADADHYVALAAKDIAAYRSIGHDPDEIRAFETFASDWQAHLDLEKPLGGLIASGKTPEAIAFFHGDSYSSFHKAARELRQLVDLTHLKAQSARDRGRKTIATAQRFMSDLILAMLALFAGLALYLWRSFSRPLLQLAGSMRRLALNDTHFKIPLENRRDEIGEMARSLAVLRRNTVELLETRKNLAMQAGLLAGTLEKERELTAAQRNFLTTMSHEFRTPLTYIDGHAQRLIAAREHAAPEQIAERAGKIRSAVFQMTSLVASLTAELEMLNAPVEAQKRPFDPAAMLRDVIDYYRDMDLKVHFDERLGELPKIRGDEKLLRRAFNNLISNAIKYSPEGGLVKISGKIANGAVDICVGDHGIGIPAGELQQVRERFFRGSNAGSIPGTGIGLSLVQQIVEQHGGRVTIASELGHGTMVTVSLPIAAGKTGEAERSLEQHLVH